jgi:hypothetical protein
VKQEVWVEDKIEEVFAKNGKVDKADVKKQNAEDDDAQHPQHQHQEQARREVRREKQV